MIRTDIMRKFNDEKKMTERHPVFRSNKKS
jgi:hypothetical protein